MGTMNSKPVRRKHTSGLQNLKYLVVSSCMQGYRPTMEDEHTHILDLAGDPTGAYFGLYDGHGGAVIAQYAKRNLHKYIANRPEYDMDNVIDALQKGFKDMDNEMWHFRGWAEQAMGTTALVLLIKNDLLYCANAGNSRAIASINGQLAVLSIDHRPVNPVEVNRILLAGGFVKNSLLNGRLSMSRAFGDYMYKNGSLRSEDHMITACPDISVFPLNQDYEFLVLASDGVWDLIRNDQMLQFIRSRIGYGLPPNQICEQLLDHCLAIDEAKSTRIGDNMTIMLVCLLHDKSYGELAERCTGSCAHHDKGVNTEVQRPLPSPLAQLRMKRSKAARKKRAAAAAAAAAAVAANATNAANAAAVAVVNPSVNLMEF